MQRNLLVLSLFLCFAGTAAPQTKISGTVTCPKPAAEHSLEVGDRPGHVFSISKSKCKWVKALELEGVQSAEDNGTNFSEVRSDGSRDRGYVVATMSNGDKLFLRYEGATTIKDNAPVAGQGTWTYTGGTGRFRGIKGKGTYKNAPNGDGTWTNEVEGEYTLLPLPQRSSLSGEQLKLN